MHGFPAADFPEVILSFNTFSVKTEALPQVQVFRTSKLEEKS